LLKDKQHLQKIREMNCTICNCPPNCDPHHITYAEKRGFGQKVGDNFTVPLCRMCHTKLHNFKHGEELFWSIQGIDPIELAEEYYGKENTQDSI
jgi:hypothetical protein